MGFITYQWSLSKGLRRLDAEKAIYQTNDPNTMLKSIIEICNSSSNESNLFILKDFHQHLSEPVTHRLLKDLIKLISDTRDTVIILSYEYKLPQDLELYATHMLCGYPHEKEINNILYETIKELPRWHHGSRVNLNESEEKKILQSLKGLTVQQIRGVLHQAVLENNCLDINDLKTIEQYRRNLYDREGMLEFYALEGDENIAGFNNLKTWLKDRKESFKAENNFNLPPPKGIMLMGVQGCGKSLAAKIVARELNLPLYQFDPGRLYGSYIGETEKNMRKTLDLADKLSPLCLWIDEIEKGFSVTNSKADGGVSQRVFGSFLTWMQERKKNTFIVATANDINALPPELLRKGRLDEIFFVDLPDLETRKELFRIHLSKRNLNPEDFDLNHLAKASKDFNGAEIEQAIISALYRATRTKEKTGTNQILEQLESTRPLAVLKREDIESLRTWARERATPV